MNLDSRLVRFRSGQLFAVSIFALCLIAIGCGGGSSISVTLTPGSAQSTMAGQVVTVTAAVANDSTSKGVTWSLSGAGALSAQTMTSVTYTAPSSIASAGTATITATSVADSSKTSTLTINLVPVSVTLSPASAQTKEQAQTVAVAATVAGDPGNKGVTWTLTGSGSLTGSTTTSVTYNAPATVAAASSATITATSITDTTKTATLTVNLVPPPSVTTTSLAAGTVGVAYSAALAATNGVSPYAWSISSGALPGGLTITGSNISGTPTAYGTFNFTVQVKDANNFTATANLGIKIAAPPVNVTTTSLPSGAVNAVYSGTLQSTGGAAPITWSVTVGSLPAGLVLNAATGAITGTPTTAGTVNFTVQAADSSTPAQTATKAVSIVVNPVLAITTTTLPAGVTGTAYNQTVQTNGGGTAPLTWSISSGALPGGLTLNSSTGAITGAPTASGSSNFTVQAKDSSTPQQTAQQALSIAVAAGPLTVTAATLPLGAVNEVYQSTNLAATGGIQPYTWSITTGALPAGLAISSAGQITGTPTASGTVSFTAQVKDSANTTATGNFSITVNAVLAVVTSSLPNGTVGSPYTATNLSASGGVTPYSWTITSGALPGGLTLSSAGQISGQPTASGTFSFTVKVSDSSSGTATANLSIIVNPAAPLSVSTTSGSLPGGTLNSAYPNTNLSATGGIQPYTWSITSGALPGGLTLSSAGQITGTPTAGGTFNFTVQVADSTTPTAQTATANLSITVNANVCGSGSESLLNGQYAIALEGFDASGPTAVGATFNADGSGHVATLVGVEDINSTNSSGVQTNLSINSASSSYSVGSDHRGCLTIATSAGTQTFRFTLGAISSGVASNGHIIQFDSTGSNTAGVLRKQDPTAFSNAQISGNYAFGVSGPEPGGGKLAAVGLLALSGGVVQSGSVFDSNDNGTIDANGTGYPASPMSFTSGSYSISSNGRGTLQLLPSGSGSTTLHVVMYVVSAQEVLLLSSDVQSVNTLFVGPALQQSGGPFANSSLNATSVLYTTGLDNSTGTTASRVMAGLFTPSSGNFSFSGQQNGSGTLKAQSATGTYSVASNGRVTLAGGGGGAPLFYLVSANRGFALFTDGSSGTPHVASGFFEPQTGGPFSTSSASGTYAFGTFQPDETGVGDEAGFATFANPSVSGTSDGNSSGTLNPNQTFGPFNYSVDSTGLGVIPAGCSIDGTNGTDGTCQTVFYIISPTKAVVLDATASTTTAHPHLEVAEK